MTNMPPLPSDFLTREEDLDQVKLMRLYRLDYPNYRGQSGQHLNHLNHLSAAEAAKRKMQEGMISVAWAMVVLALTLSEMGKWQGW